MPTRRLLLFGYPVAHSLSPAMHNAALQAVGLEGWSYTARSVTPDELPQAVKMLRQPEFVGANVTIPHKEHILPLLDRLTPAARAIGAINVIYKDGEALVGENADGPGFLADLKQKLLKVEVIHNESSAGERANSSLYRGNALVLGAGGAAHGVVYVLHQAGWQITLAARRIEQAQSIASRYPPGAVQAIDFPTGKLVTDSLSTDLLVNTTPLGMHPDMDGCPWPADIPLPPKAFVYDLVYKPAQTPLLRRAQAAGLPHANGLGMLVEQAVMGFELWTGLPAPRDVMYRAVQV